MRSPAAGAVMSASLTASARISMRLVLVAVTRRCTALLTSGRPIPTGNNPGNKLSATEEHSGARIAANHVETRRMSRDRCGWGPGGRRFKSCLPDLRKGRICGPFLSRNVDDIGWSGTNLVPFVRLNVPPKLLCDLMQLAEVRALYLGRALELACRVIDEGVTGERRPATVPRRASRLCRPTRPASGPRRLQGRRRGLSRAPGHPRTAA